ncbi:hypothetical protein G3I44_07955 [Halogeometricum borinquense]|uniref:Uncharacterized protein n=1 Tax=Halogeometricum borinquense TaxID=60847 RepID=A0A6C0UC35_9EURY|nr:hypothetical protein [Halogeometricum borinquense]QIB72795.1 hypothetical protein G3I44_07955 [Halogeometricum borinquense]
MVCDRRCKRVAATLGGRRLAGQLEEDDGTGKKPNEENHSECDSNLLRRDPIPGKFESACSQQRDRRRERDGVVLVAPGGPTEDECSVEEYPRPEDASSAETLDDLPRVESNVPDGVKRWVF